MLIAVATDRDQVRCESEANLSRATPRSARAKLRYALGYLRLLLAVYAERRALLRMTAAQRADIGRNRTDIDAEAKRSPFDLPAHRLEALRCDALRSV